MSASQVRREASSYLKRVEQLAIYQEVFIADGSLEEEALRALVGSPCVGIKAIIINNINSFRLAVSLDLLT